MGGGIPSVKMSQAGSCAILAVAWYADIPFFSQVAANVLRAEKLRAALQSGNRTLRRSTTRDLIRN